MLVLSRRAGEAIVVGGNIRIVVLSVTGSSVRFGVEAPRSISVHREEVLTQAGFSPGEESSGSSGEPPRTRENRQG